MSDEMDHRSARAFGWLWLVFCGAWMASLAAGWTQLRQRSAGGIFLGMGVEFLLAWAVLHQAFRWEGRSRGRSWPRFLLGVGFVLKLPALCLMKTYGQVMDRGFFVSFVNRLAREGLAAAGVDNLARSVYDFYSFFPRSFTLGLPIRLLVGEAAMVPTHQGVCLVLALLSTWMVYELLRFVFNDRTARLASGLHLFFPLRNIVFLDFAHQVPGEFVLLLGLTSLLGALRAESAGRRWSWALGLGGSLVLGHLLVGVDILIAGMGMGILVLGWRSFPAPLRMRNMRWVLCSALLAGGVGQAFTSWQNRMAPSPLSSGQPGFMARGWSFRGWGEYDGWLEVVDREAPPEVKAPLMRAYVWSQIRSQPARVFALLLPVKAIKYFLPGFASGSEQALEAGGHVAAADFMAGARIFYALFLLAAVVLGCLRLGTATEAKGLFFCLFFLGLLCVAQILGGETSPRYAFHLHFLLLGVAARGLDFQQRLAGGLRWMGAGLAHGIAYGVLAVALAVLLRAQGPALFLREMRTVGVEPPATEWVPDAVDKDYFWRTAIADGEGALIRLSIPAVPRAHPQLHLLMSAGNPAGWQYSCDGMAWRELRSAQGVLLDVSPPPPGAAGEAKVAVRFRKAAAREKQMALEVGIGYILSGDFKRDNSSVLHARGHHDLDSALE